MKTNFFFLKGKKKERKKKGGGGDLSIVHLKDPLKRNKGKAGEGGITQFSTYSAASVLELLPLQLMSYQLLPFETMHHVVTQICVQSRQETIIKALCQGPKKDASSQKWQCTL